MSRIVSDLIRSKVAADAIDDLAADTLTWLIHDALPADAGLDDIDRAITQARDGFSPLFRKPDSQVGQTRAAAPVARPLSTRPQPTDVYGHPRRSDEEIASNRVRAGTAGGNPWAQGSINITRQAMVSAADPDLAARLKREAGA